MDITKAVKHWQMDPRTNQGLSLEFLEAGTIKQIYPTKLGFNGNVSLSETIYYPPSSQIYQTTVGEAGI